MLQIGSEAGVFGVGFPVGDNALSHIQIIGPKFAEVYFLVKR